MRLYLFDQGIDFPFSTPRSPAGRSDIVGLIDTSAPLIMEIKVYDKEKNYRKNRIISGFSQIVRYTADYNKHVGYLTVFNLDQIEIEIEQQQAGNRFPYSIEFNGKIFYLIIINLNTDTSASKVGKLPVERILLEELYQGVEQVNIS
ncbi:hypothetical protein QFZ51_003531 [Chitinophaga sp. W3I9]|uniref:hypothetical protein n=1 Tax=Chitinophaga sp. W3I9 TaxID=3373924 RepID=UPI003D1D77DC